MKRVNLTTTPQTQAVTNIQRLTRGHTTPPISFSNLPKGPLNKMCSLLDLNTRLSLTLTSKEHRRSATEEATQWVNKQLEDQNPFLLIKKIENIKSTIPDHLCVRITINILINPAIEFINETFTDDRFKSLRLKDMCDTLLANGNINQAIEVANTIPRDPKKSQALRDISKTLLANGNFDQAIDLANTIPDDHEKSIALQDISKILLANGNFDQAIEVANTIPKDRQKSQALRDISQHV